ncbi:zinc-ribbon domain-containing protein [Halarchaeum sp. P4]|uniref:zinc-ribbon domain-containing protein n=1 Tax=Halarchaeum sp. P4 TaxID=3421639 RepID=UPI003EBFCC74
MPKITFRADADLVERVERLDASKSEVMRRALRAYLDGDAERAADTGATSRARDAEGSLDTLVDARIERRLREFLDEQEEASDRDDVTVNVTLNGADVEQSRAADATAGRTSAESSPAPDAPSDAPVCSQCGESLDEEHVFCPNCGERAAGHPTCECGAELRSDWAFCPDCGRRTVSADVLDR